MCTQLCGSIFIIKTSDLEYTQLHQKSNWAWIIWISWIRECAVTMYSECAQHNALQNGSHNVLWSWWRLPVEGLVLICTDAPSGGDVFTWGHVLLFCVKAICFCLPYREKLELKSKFWGRLRWRFLRVQVQVFIKSSTTTDWLTTFTTVDLKTTNFISSWSTKVAVTALKFATSGIMDCRNHLNIEKGSFILYLILFTPHGPL